MIPKLNDIPCDVFGNERPVIPSQADDDESLNLPPKTYRRMNPFKDYDIPHLELEELEIEVRHDPDANYISFDDLYMPAPQGYLSAMASGYRSMIHKLLRVMWQFEPDEPEAALFVYDYRGTVMAGEWGYGAELIFPDDTNITSTTTSQDGQAEMMRWVQDQIINHMLDEHSKEEREKSLSQKDD